MQYVALLGYCPSEQLSCCLRDTAGNAVRHCSKHVTCVCSWKDTSMLAMIRRRTSNCASSIQTTTSKATMCSFRRSPALRLRTESHGWTGPNFTPFSLYTPTMTTTLITCILSHKSGSDQVGFLALTHGYQCVQALQQSTHDLLQTCTFVCDESNGHIMSAHLMHTVSLCFATLHIHRLSANPHVVHN